MRKAHDNGVDVTVIKPSRGWVMVNFKEIWRYNELLYFLIWRDIKVRYKQTYLGILWAIIQPFFMMVLFTLFFGKFMKVPREGISYPLFSYAGLLPWIIFSEGINRSTNSIVQDSSLIKKVYFPRLILPLSGVISPVVDFFFSLAVFLCLMFYFGVMPTLKILLLPFFILLAVISALSIGLWLSALNVRYRDVRYTIQFLLQFLFFASPIVYSSTSLPRTWQLFYGLNPMVSVIEGFRWILLGTEPPSLLIVISIIMVICVLISGALYFRRMEKVFSDIV